MSKVIDDKWAAAMRIVFLLLFLTSDTCFAGFVTIDEFNDPPDNLGARIPDGMVKYKDGFVSMTSGYPESDKIVSLHYSFVPAPLVVKPKIVLTAKNNQTTYEESGWLRVSINNLPYIQQELFAAKQNYELLVFDFTYQLPASETISELRIDWLRPDNTTGARELLIDSIVVSDVPEPPTLAMICVASLVVGTYHCRSLFTLPPFTSLRSRRNGRLR